jgi:WS/DGAT/MGAT family acyltransferase
MRQLTSVDTQFLAVEDGRVTGHVMTLGIYDPATAPDGQLTAATVENFINQRIHLLAPLRSRLIEVPLSLDLPYWAEDPEFDVTRHVSEHRVATPGDDHMLAELVADIAARPLDRARPLWEIHVIHGLERGRVAVLFKCNHSLMDGISGTGFFSTLLDPSADGIEIAAGTRPVGQLPTSAEMIARGIGGLVRHPFRMLNSLPKALPHLDLVPSLGVLPGVGTAASLTRQVLRVGGSTGDGKVIGRPAAHAPRTRFNRRVSDRRHYAFASLSVAEVKAIKNHFDVTVNDVVMAIAAGAMRTWLSERGELPARPLVALVPISVRIDDGTSYGNQIGMLVPALPTDEPDAVRRLLRVHESLSAAKSRHRAVPATLLQDANHFIPPAIFARAARAMTIVGTSPLMGVSANLLVSNIPGPSEPMFLAGARLDAHYPVGTILHGLGLTIGVMRCNDHLDWGVICDRFEKDDAWSIVSAIQLAQQELVDALPAASQST